MTGEVPRASVGSRSKKPPPLTPDPSPPRHFVFPARRPAQAGGRGEPNRARCGGMTQLPDELSQLPDELSQLPDELSQLPDELELTLPPLAQQKPDEDSL